MKKTINLIMLALFLVAGLQPVSAKKKATEIEDSVKFFKTQIDSLDNRAKGLTDEIRDLENDVIVSKDTVNRMTTRLNQLKETRDYLNNEKDELKKFTVTDEDIAKIENEIDQFQISFVQMASAFLYMPYSGGALEKIAIPAFEQAKGSSYYEDYSIILTLLNNYKADREELKTFIVNSLNAFKPLGKPQPQTSTHPKKEESDSLSNKTPDLLAYHGNTQETENIEDNNTQKKPDNTNNDQEDQNLIRIKDKLNELKKDFNNLHCVIDYKAYGEGWEDTYLGEIINGIDKIFKDRSSAKNLDNVSKIFEEYLERLK